MAPSLLAAPTLRMAMRRSFLLRHAPQDRDVSPRVLQLEDHLAKLGERVAQLDASQQQYAGTLSLTQRQQAVLERRVAALEENAARAQQRMAEASRLASTVALQHKGVEALVQQMERLVLRHSSNQTDENGWPQAPPLDAPSSASTAPSKPKEGMETSGNATQREGEGQNGSARAPSAARSDEKSTNTEKKEPEVTHTMRCVPNSYVPVEGAAVYDTSLLKDEISTRVTALDQRLEALQARVDQLSLSKIILDRIQQQTQQQQQQQPEGLEAAVARVSGNATPRALAETLRCTGAFPFKDSGGATRISSQRVLVRGVPLMCGAAEVRDLFARVGNVLACTVRRQHTKPNSTETPNGRYRSQHEDETEEMGVTQTNPNVTERAFEVTFRTAEESVRAVLQFDGHCLRENVTISVEPVVSADIIAALHELEQESAGRKRKRKQKK